MNSMIIKNYCTMNGFYEYLLQKQLGNYIKEIISSLLELQKKRRINGLIPENAIKADEGYAISALCDYLSDGLKKWKYFYIMALETDFYDCFSKMFCIANPTDFDKVTAMNTFGANLEELYKIGYFEKNKTMFYNHILFYDESGSLGSVEIPDLLDFLFKDKLDDEIALLLEL